MGYKHRRVDNVDLSKTYLTTVEAASVLECDPLTLRNRNRRGIGPFPAHTDGRPILFRTEDVINLQPKYPTRVVIG